MENDFESHERPTSAEARDALSALDADGASLAERMVTPWWYHLCLGLIVAVLTGAQALPGAYSIIVIALGIIAIPLLTTAYNQRYGISTTQPAGPRSRRLLFIAVAFLVVAMVSALVLKLTEQNPAWGLVPAAVAAVATVLIGRRYDDALRAELSGSAGEKA